MEKYIGGDFDLSSTNAFLNNKNEADYFPEALDSRKRFFFETGSDALAQIILEIFKKSNKALNFCIPAHYCHETIGRVSGKLKTLVPEFTINYYDFVNFKPAFITGKTNVILFNHFNLYDQNVVKHNLESREKGWITVEDFVHAPLDMRKICSDYGFNSLRKFLSLEISVAYIPDCTQLTLNKTSLYYPMKKKAAAIKSDFLRTGDAALEKQYLQLFKSAEASLSEEGIISAAEKEIQLFKEIDWEKILQKRMMNYSLLLNEMNKATSYNIIPGKYSYLMISTFSRDELQSFMYSNGIFPVVHWRDSRAPLKDVQLSLHIDQRYSEEDMLRVARLLSEFNNRKTQ